ncbi:MAG: UDP-3-O-(3-hydroxymyristoyl)glucosamine N-acyltransferase [Cycloclasticus sp. symbiont of Poecilosclerida sp. M]|nr:MAG: UDP-3-O-(3-hydroxymyristoyl)glucosamine N-acyltransferase [Cycloclasticus sp. symbiont of Poecilosclerida sp. M]
MKKTLGQLADELGAKLIGDNSAVVDGCASLDKARSNELSFVYQSKFLSDLKKTKAGVVILKEEFHIHCPVNALVVKDPYLSYACAASLLTFDEYEGDFIHQSAVISDPELVSKNCRISANVYLGKGVILGEGCFIGAGCVVEDNSVIGAGVRLKPNVTVYANSQIGNNVILHAGCVIGSDGFGYAPTKNKTWTKIPQIGRVVIDDDVEVGANSTIDCGALGDTYIQKGVKLDNLVHIAHNVSIGEHTAIAACTGIAGSTVIGKHCTIAGAVGIIGHLNITDDVHITARTLVTRSISESGAYSSGTPMQKNKDWLKNTARFKQLDKITKTIIALRKAGRD